MIYKRMLRLVLISVIFMVYKVQCSKDCPNGWSYYSNKCYYISSAKKTYSNALSDCKSKNANLAIPNDANEFNFFNWYYLTNTNLYFLGIYDNGNNNFVAIDSSTAYLSWCAAEPDTNGGSFDGACVLMFGGCYRDNACSQKNYYVCEAPSCTADQYFDDSTSSCRNWNTCSTNSDCNSSLNQVCVAGKCSCETNLVWTGSTCQTCPTDWTSYGTSCYKVVKSSKRYNDALNYCKRQGYGASLAIPNSVAEFTNLQNITTTSGTHYFIGIYDFGDKQFAAIDNSTSYLSWCSGEPNNGAKANNPEACTVLEYTGCLNDTYCTNTNYFICEIKK